MKGSFLSNLPKPKSKPNLNSSIFKKTKSFADLRNDKLDIVKKLKIIDYQTKWNKVLINAKKAYEENWEIPRDTIKFENFEIYYTLGKGAYGRVKLAKCYIDANYYAIKVLSKRRLVHCKQVEHVLNEKNIMSSLDFPFLTRLAYSFKDNANLFLVLEFVNGGELFTYLIENGALREEQVRFYISQVVLAIEYMHSLDILHRDLKPENTLISTDGYLKITDFGFAKIVKTRTYTICGTPQYLAPEIIENKGYGKAVDWWCIGVLTYELATGRPPFNHQKNTEIYKKILKREYNQSGLSNELKDLLNCLIELDVTKRYGNLRNGVDDIKNHIWFKSIDWWAIYEKRVKPQYIPKVRSAGDAQNFKRYTEHKIEKSPNVLFEQEFEDF